MKLKTKKELEDFLNKRDFYIDFLIGKLNEYGIKGESLNEFLNKIDPIQKYFEEEFNNQNEDDKKNLRLGFWAFFSKLLIEKLGGEIIIASKSDYSAGTPLLINYGNRYDKKGKRKWIGIAFDSWLNTHLKGLNNFSLKEKIDNLIKDYS
jgi:hypothetical protein